MRTILLLAVCALGLQAQSVHFGVKGGLPLNDAIDATGAFKSDFRNFTIGPMVDIFLPLGLAVEVDALYKKTGYTVSGVQGEVSHGASSWEFPLLVKYRFPGGTFRPYIGGGYSFRSISDMARLETNGSHGLVLGGGLLIDLKLVRFSPELRYTHWNNDVFSPSAPGASLKSAANQAEFLVGFTF